MSVSKTSEKGKGTCVFLVDINNHINLYFSVVPKDPINLNLTKYLLVTLKVLSYCIARVNSPLERSESRA